MKTMTIRDDVTGAELPESREIAITVGDVSGTLDLGPDSLAALAALARGEGPALLAALLSPPASGGKRSGGRKTGTRDGKPDPVTGASPDAIRAWATSQGISVNTRGRVPADVREKYRAAHSGGSAPASAPSAPESGESAPATGRKTARSAA